MGYIHLLFSKTGSPFCDLLLSGIKLETLLFSPSELFTQQCKRIGHENISSSLKCLNDFPFLNKHWLFQTYNVSTPIVFFSPQFPSGLSKIFSFFYLTCCWQFFPHPLQQNCFQTALFCLLIYFSFSSLHPTEKIYCLVVELLDCLWWKCLPIFTD